MNDSKKDIALVVVLTIGFLIVLSIFLYGNIQDNDAQEYETARLTKLFPDVLPNLDLQAEKMFLTHDENIILKDPAGDLSRIELSSNDQLRPANPGKYKHIKQVNEDLIR